jgi:uncharacterized membrane protein
MTLTPLLDAEQIIQLHVLCASIGLLLGPVSLYQPRRGRLHQVVGYVWVLAMGATALSAFFIHSFPMIGPFSPIHGLAIFTLWSLFKGMQHVFAGRIREHQMVMRSLYWHGLAIAGLFKFLPGRTLNRMVFDDAHGFGYGVIAAGIAGIVLASLRRRKGQAAASWAT